MAGRDVSSDRSGIERRRYRRHRVLKRGKAILHDKSTIIDCTIRDVSDGGARLQIGQFCIVPSRFRLGFVSDGVIRETFEVSVVWRHADQIGVAFLVAPEE
jgi:hypothetical protein